LLPLSYRPACWPSRGLSIVPSEPAREQARGGGSGGKPPHSKEAACWPLLPGAGHRKERKAARSGAQGAVDRLCMSRTIKRGSRQVCHNATLMRSPAYPQHSYNPLKTHGNMMSLAQNTSKKRDAWGKWKSRPHQIRNYNFAASANSLKRSATLFTCRASGSFDPSSKMGISFSSSGPETAPVRATRMG